jgi:deoxyribonuclease-4
MPKRLPSPIGAHLPSVAHLSTTGLAHAEQVGAEAAQVFVSNPRAWAQPAGDAAADEAFRAHCAAAGIPVFVHAPYLVNLGSPTETTVHRSVDALRHAAERGRRIGARGIVFHAGSAVDDGHREAALAQLRERLLPVLDEVHDAPAGADGPAPRLLVEPTAGGGRSLAATVDDLSPFFAALDGHPGLGVCLDTCHLYAAGHDLAAAGGVRRTLNRLLAVVGRARLALVHANDSRDPLGSRRDRHASIGAGTIGTEPFAELFRHPATRGVPIVVETPMRDDGHARDVATLKSLRDR